MAKTNFHLTPHLRVRSLGFLVCLTLSCILIKEVDTNDRVPLQKNTVLVVMLARNKAHTLPFFLSQFQKLVYPKHRIALW